MAGNFGVISLRECMKFGWCHIGIMTPVLGKLLQVKYFKKKLGSTFLRTLAYCRLIGLFLLFVALSVQMFSSCWARLKAES